MDNSYTDNLRKELNELLEVKRMVESANFQKHIIEPVEEMRDEIRYAYDCESLKQLYTMKGRHQFIEEFFKILKAIDFSVRAREKELQEYGS